MPMKARVKLAAYPFQKYGMLDGTVEHVSADSQDKTPAKEVETRRPGNLAYRARIRLARSSAQ